jgi:hypothetical protein
MKSARQVRLEQIDRRWALQDYQDSSKGDAGNCLAFVVDERYATLPRDPPELQFRLGASFGHNPFTPKMACGFVPPPVRPGEYVFGVHVIGVQGNVLTIYDEWCDAREAPDGVNAANAAEYARAILTAIPDDEYLLAVTEDPEDKASLQRSDHHDLAWFEIADGGAF